MAKEDSQGKPILRAGAIIDQHIFEVLSQLNDNDAGKFIKLYLHYSLYGSCPEIPKNYPPVIHSLMILSEIYIKKNIKKYDSKVERFSYKNKVWRDSVFKIYDYTCQKCHQKGVELNAHHIKPFAQYPELRYDLDNGVALCKKCHIKEHQNAE
jgi:hypothetical protein